MTHYPVPPTPWSVREIQESSEFKLPLNSLLLFAPFGNFRVFLLFPSHEGHHTKIEGAVSELSRKLGKVSVKLVGDPALCRAVGKIIPNLGLTSIRVIPVHPHATVRIKITEKRVQVVKESVLPSSSEDAHSLTRESKKIQVMIIDDSEVMRKILAHIIESDPQLEVLATADRPSEAEAILKNLRPDVITLDLHMPEKSGTEFYKDTLKSLKIPTVIVSALSIEEGTEVLDALEAGAIDYIQKPEKLEMARTAPLLLERLKSAAKANLDTADELDSSPTLLHTVNSGRTTVPLRTHGTPLVLIGASTGGTEAIKKILKELPTEIPPILIVQHIPPGFSRAFAERLNQMCPFPVCEAENGMPVIPGKAYVAPGGKQMRVVASSRGLRIEISDSPPVNRHKPSVDYLFHSASRLPDVRIFAALLTGMGDDGARGLLELKKSGALTLAQDERSSVVYGMPREAVRLGAALRVLHLKNIGESLSQWTRETKGSSKAA